MFLEWHLICLTIEKIGGGWSISGGGGNISWRGFKWKYGVQVVTEVWIYFIVITEVIVVLIWVVIDLFNYQGYK